MDAETLVVAQTKEEVYLQASAQLITNREVVLPFISKTVIPERGNEAEDEKHEVEEEKHDSAKLYFNSSNSFIYMKNGPAIGIALSPTEEVREIYLKNMFMMPANHEFYCPSCDACISKVLLCSTRPVTVPPVIVPPVTVPPVAVSPATVPPVTVPWAAIPPVAVSPDTVPPVTVPWAAIPPVAVSPGTVPPVTVPPPTVPPVTPEHEEDVQCLVRCSECFTLLIQKGKEFFTGFVSGPSGEPDSEEITVAVTDPSDTVPEPIITRGSRKGWEVLKSIVYGGLAELLASLSVVTSAASADAATVSIVALGIANLIGGLTVLTHNLRDLKASKPREEEESETNNAEVDKYYELLGNRDNFYLHAFFAILSFLIFGLVPPLVYGFSFGESDDKDMKLAAVAGASLICITFLAIAKAHTQITNKTFMTYFKTVTFYVTSGVLASLLTYLAGAQMKKLVEQLGWFQPKPNFAFTLPEISVENSGWGSY